MSNPLPSERNTSREPRAGFSQHTVRLAWILAAAYLLVIVHASLQPFRGWRPPPEEILRFLFAPWPRYITLQDVVVNFAAYVPLGLLLSMVLGARYGPARGAVAATLAAVLASLTLETVQMFLPARIASNVDLLANGVGALVGAMAAPLLTPARVLGGGIHGARHRLFLEGMPADAGLIVVGLWLITQFHPTAQLFGAGALRATLDLPSYFTHTPWLALSGEAMVVLLNLLGVGLLLSACTRQGERRMLVIGAVIGTALGFKVFNAVALVQTSAPFAWLTPGVLLGLCAGWLLLWGAVRLPRLVQLAVSAACIGAATIAINLAPDNPYHSVPPQLLARGASHYLSFSGIVRALSELWPLLAIGFLVYALAARKRGGE
ncbi:MAG: VanZ family protein [Burkholderiales bacterium]